MPSEIGIGGVDCPPGSDSTSSQPLGSRSKQRPPSPVPQGPIKPLEVEESPAPEPGSVPGVGGVVRRTSTFEEKIPRPANHPSAKFPRKRQTDQAEESSKPED